MVLSVALVISRLIAEGAVGIIKSGHGTASHEAAEIQFMEIPQTHRGQYAFIFWIGGAMIYLPGWS